jgi:zinc transport system substrate-binding protein
MKLKRLFLCLLAALVALFSTTSCSNGASGGSGKLDIVCTIFPEYDWVREILGDHTSGAELTMLLDNGVDLHSYQPTAEDIVKISSCDIFIYVGGESDCWVDDVLTEATNKDMIVINLLEVLGGTVKEEEVADGASGGIQAGQEHLVDLNDFLYCLVLSNDSAP